jgi:phosphoribosylformylglycinamidine synthase
LRAQTTLMLYFFTQNQELYYAIESSAKLNDSDLKKMSWLLGEATLINTDSFDCPKDIKLLGPRAAMVSPWSTNAVEITQNMGITGITRLEEYKKITVDFQGFDPMLFEKFDRLHQNMFHIDIEAAGILAIDDIAAFNQQEGLALSDEEVLYLVNLATKLGRKLTDSEVFGFSQVNSEHCRHKIFNGTFIIDGQEQKTSLFKLIKETSAQNPNQIVSAYKDNVAFIKGPEVVQFAPEKAEHASFYQEESFESVLSLKAETHNFPTTVEPFNGAATGAGGEIRDRLAGGTGSLPLAGTAVYMTAYPRLRKEANLEIQFS